MSGSLRTAYIANVEINDLQKDIMLFVMLWIRTYKTTVPQKEIVTAMGEKGIKDFTVLNALASLIKKGFIRKSANSAFRSRAIEYTQLRTV